MKKLIGLLLLTTAITTNAFADGWTGPLYITEIEANSLTSDDGRFKIFYSTTKGGPAVGVECDNKFDHGASKANLAAALTTFAVDTPIRLYLISNDSKFKSIKILNQ